MSKIYFINFSGSVSSSNISLQSRQKLLNKSAKLYGNIDETIEWNRQDIIKTSFYHSNREILDQERGAGFWSWKPYIILETLSKVSNDDWVIYCDVGKPFRRGNPERNGNVNIGNIIHTEMNPIIDFASDNKGFTPGVWIPNYGLANVWTKRDCFVGMNCDDPIYHNSPQVQAGYSAWSKSKESILFLKEWLKWCQVPAVISDNRNIYGKPNLAMFRDHRHDQSILTNLCIKHKINLFGPRETSLSGYRNFNFILRHMMLKQSHKKDNQNFSLLFEQKSPQLPKFINELLALLFLTEKQIDSRILIDNHLDIQQWQKALPNSIIDLYPRNITKEQYNGIFIPYTSEKKLNAQLIYSLFDSLKPGGIMLIGQFENIKTDEPTINGSFSQFISWLELHQRMPDTCENSEYRRPHALTVGGRLNPVVTHTNNGKCSYVLLMKPIMYLNDFIEKFD